MATVSVVVAAEGEPGRQCVSSDEDPQEANLDRAPIFMPCITRMLPAVGASGFCCLLQESVGTVDVNGCLELERARHLSTLLGWTRALRGFCRYVKANVGGISDCLMGPVLWKGQDGNGTVIANERVIRQQVILEAMEGKETDHPRPGRAASLLAF